MKTPNIVENGSKASLAKHLPTPQLNEADNLRPQWTVNYSSA